MATNIVIIARDITNNRDKTILVNSMDMIWFIHFITPPQM